MNDEAKPSLAVMIGVGKHKPTPNQDNHEDEARKEAGQAVIDAMNASDPIAMCRAIKDITDLESDDAGYESEGSYEE